jgi:hypothetical protein
MGAGRCFSIRALGFPNQETASSTVRYVADINLSITLRRFAEVVAEARFSVYLGKQDDRQLQPNYFYLPLLARRSGIGGVGSSER